MARICRSWLCRVLAKKLFVDRLPYHDYIISYNAQGLEATEAPCSHHDAFINSSNMKCLTLLSEIVRLRTIQHKIKQRRFDNQQA